MKYEDCIKKACQVLRKRVRFDGAGLRLPTTEFPNDDTPAIKEATRIYTESWIIPLIDCIESGDMSPIKKFYQIESGHEMKVEGTQV